MIRLALVRTMTLVLMCGVFAAAVPCQAQDNYRRAPDYDLPQFIARLPKYCYAQYFDQKLWNNPEYSIITACGIGFNHFCPGLLNIMRVESTIPKKFNRREELRYAKENVEYTLSRLPGSPGCIYRDDINAAKARVTILQQTVR